MELKSFRSRLLFLALSFLLGTAVVTPTSAQGLFGMGLPGSPSFGGYQGDAGSCQGKVGSKLAPLTFYVGYIADPSDGLAITLTAHVPGFGDTESTTNLPFRGAWLGLSTDLALTDRMGVMAGGGLLIPSKTRGSTITDVPPDISPGYRLLDQFSIIDGAFYFNTCASAKLLGGFRWDRLDTNIKLSTPEFVDRNDYTFNAYLPYLGVQVDQGCATVRVIGFPAVPGNVRNAEVTPVPFPLSAAEATSYRFKSGQFLEVFASYGKRLSDSMELGGFLTYNYLHAETVLVTPVLLNFFPQSNSVTYNRRFWTLGGSFSWSFNLL
jgi:hypothetical protein